jgi:hypothetical protein
LKRKCEITKRTFWLAGLASSLFALGSCASFTLGTEVTALERVSAGLTDNQVEHLSALSTKLRSENAGSCLRTNEGGKTVLVYIGDTDYHLIACLNVGGGHHRAVLRITSPGGNSDIAALAAIYLRLYDMSVEVDGICFSSCANYIAPAANRLVILPFSFLGLHGAPSEYSEVEARSIEAGVRAMPDVPAAKMEQYVRSNIAMLHRTSEYHKMVQRTLNVGTEWFRLDSIDLPEEALAASELLLIPSKAMTEKCLKGIKSLKMWEATQDYEKAALKMIFPTIGVDLFVDLPEANQCD